MIGITIKKAIRYARQNGLLAMLFHIKAKLIGGYNPFNKISVIDNYDKLFGNNFGALVDAKNLSAKTINWFIPPFGRGSGGHLNIFRFIK